MHANIHRQIKSITKSLFITQILTYNIIMRIG